MIEFTTIEEFYDDRPERRRSPESDYGVHWRDEEFGYWPQWRVSYIQATGEVYAVRLLGNPAGPVRVLGVVKPDPDTRYQPGGDLNGPTYYRTLDGILDGWADPDVSGHDLAWVGRRLS